MTVVTTGGGIGFDQVGPGRPVIDLETLNPSGFPSPSPTTRPVLAVLSPHCGLLPLARQISGQVYAFEPNPAEVDALGLVFDSAEATCGSRRPGSDQLLSLA